jgi:hypothetical protein
VGKGGSAGIQTKKLEIPAIKMTAQTLIERTIFSQFPLFTSYSFLQTLLTSIDFLFQAVLNNSWHEFV